MIDGGGTFGLPPHWAACLTWSRCPCPSPCLSFLVLVSCYMYLFVCVCVFPPSSSSCCCQSVLSLQQNLLCLWWSVFDEHSGVRWRTDEILHGWNVTFLTNNKQKKGFFSSTIFPNISVIIRRLSRVENIRFLSGLWGEYSTEIRINRV